MEISAQTTNITPLMSPTVLPECCFHVEKEQSSFWRLGGGQEQLTQLFQTERQADGLVFSLRSGAFFLCQGEKLQSKAAALKTVKKSWPAW